jgi:AbrB family looped-hinge helix DNA binding protein
MIAKVSVKGQMVIPEAVREQARLRPGDEVEIGYANGLIVLRKRRPLTAARVRSMLRTGSDLPPLTPKDEDAVADAVQRIRRRTRS